MKIMKTFDLLDNKLTWFHSLLINKKIHVDVDRTFENLKMECQVHKKISLNWQKVFYTNRRNPLK